MFAISTFSYEVDDVLHPLFQAGHAQFPYFELHSFLFEHLASQAHGRNGIIALGRMFHKLLMEFMQVGHCQRGGVGTLFEINDMLCHVVETNEIVVAIVAVYRCCECEIESGLGHRLDLSKLLHVDRQIDIPAPSC